MFCMSDVNYDEIFVTFAFEATRAFVQIRFVQGETAGHTIVVVITFAGAFSEIFNRRFFALNQKSYFGQFISVAILRPGKGRQVEIEFGKVETAEVRRTRIICKMSK